MTITHPTETPAAASGAAGRVREAAERVRGLCTEVGSLSDADLVRAAGAVEALGRLVDALRVRAAGEIEDRSSQGLGEDRLSARYGCRTGSELLERLTGAPGREVRRRAGLDARTRAGVSLTGEELPARFPDIADALHAGSLGIETAELLTGMLTRVGPRADLGAVSAAEAALVATATATGTYSAGQDSATRDSAGEDPAGDDTNTPDDSASTGVPAATYAEVKIHTQAWEAHLDQDGPDPEASRATTRRGLTLGSARDGLIPVRGNLMPETAAQLTRLLSAYLNPAARTHGTDPNPETDNGGSAVVSGTPVVDERTPAQKRHDVLASILTAAARAAETPSLGGDAATLLVHITAEDLTDPTGLTTLDGIDIPAPARIAHRIACAGAVQKVLFDRAGRIVALGTKERVFNAHQRRAITARDGGCVIPGCTIPASWCEIHHVHAHAENGPTHTDNGVLLCWFHHHHLENSGWEIRMTGGVPRVKAPHWYDPSGAYRPVVNVLTRRGRHHRPEPPPGVPKTAAIPNPGALPAPTPAPDTGPAPDTRPDPSTGPKADAGAAVGRSDAETSTGNRTGECAGPGRNDQDATASGSTPVRNQGETTRAFAIEEGSPARWDPTHGQSLEEVAEERRRRWNAADDEPPW
ncbi:HNH endonuclease signature motif containing protein [Zhihengliuella halotolerans]|uniref:HNH endonuclease signature motif containing protein n=1 Tax=Zhihengliuella halotolerans TaxID=370736 RepID=UPI000C80070D|nr:HNH endonuclease signature motif containing protein [Zhihengliuella halotolerans]